MQVKNTGSIQKLLYIQESMADQNYENIDD